MKLVGTERGQVALLFPWVDIRPPQGMTITQTVMLLTERYRFQFPPSLDRPWTEIEGQTLRFFEGFFETDQAIIPITSLFVYSDGLAVECSDTQHAEAVVADLVAWARESHGFRPFMRPPLKIYASAVVVQFERSLEKLFGKWAKIRDSFSKPIQEVYGIPHDVSLNRLSVKCDPLSLLHANLISEYVLERRVGERFSEEIYYCAGPLPTARLVDLLGALEGLA